jgi:hypothetical protein
MTKELKYIADKVSGISCTLHALSIIMEVVRMNNVRNKYHFPFYALTLNVPTEKTDEGGITCHAAIISREMKKPCIIGTTIATKVLKDGDEVKVDADEGVVRVKRA